MDSTKVPKATWGKPQDPDAPERPPGKPKGGFPERGLNGAYKVPQAHLPPPNLPDVYKRQARHSGAAAR